MGHVYLAVSLGPAGVQKLVVIKHLREDLASSVASRSMFLDEARISTRLNHPNIVQTNEVFDEGEDLYLVMDFLDGQPLSRILDPKYSSAFSQATRLRIMAGVLEGLHYAHELTDYDGKPLNVVHRDVSPQNIIVTYDGHVKLLDFGVAKAADATTVTESGVFKGKVRYSSPEQAMCGQVDRRADIFAVGTILWELIANRRMWKADADASVLIALGSGQIPSLREALPDVSPQLEAIVSRALAPDPQNRFPTAAVFQAALNDYIRSLGDTANLGALMVSMFSKERRELQAAIDVQTKALREATSGRLTMRDIPVLAPESTPSMAPERTARSALAIEPPSLRPAALRGTRTSWVVVGSAVAAIFLGVVGLTRMGGSSESPPVPIAAAAPPPAPELPTAVHVTVKASPANARIVLDGKPVSSNPYRSDVARDDNVHRLHVSAEGYQSQDLDTRFVRDVDMLVALVPNPQKPAPQSVQASAPAPRGAIVHGGPNPPPKRPDRSIDEEDPYQ